MPIAVAVIQFYLPYLLPRAPDWPAGVLEGTVGQIVVRLRIPPPEEDLFAADVDRDLGAMSVAWDRPDPPVRHVVTPMSTRCLDRIEATVEGPIANLADVSKESVQLEFFNAAAQLTNRLIDHIRCASGATFITGVEAIYLAHAGGSFARTPFTVRWADAGGNPLAAYNGTENETGNTGLYFDPDRGSTSWAAIQPGLASGNPPALPASLMVIAREQLIQMRVREAILSAATACEVANTEYITRKGRVGDAAVDAALNATHDSFAKKRFDIVPRIIDTRSLANEDSNSYEALEDMYRGRNSIIHAGRLEYRRAGATITIRIPEAQRLLNGAKVAITWLNAL